MLNLIHSDDGFCTIYLGAKCIKHEKVKHITFPVYFTICLAVDDMTKDKSYSALTTYFPFRYFNSWLEPSSSAEKNLNLGIKKVGNGETRHHWHFSDLIIQPIHCNVCHSLLLTTKGIISFSNVLKI